jgi:uncharacterized protein YjiS (DUF1127 family)
MFTVTAQQNALSAKRNNLRLENIMAYVNTSRAASFGLADRFAAALQSVKAAMSRRAIYTQTVRELNALSPRELADLGIARSQIGEIAHEAAYGK